MSEFEYSATRTITDLVNEWEDSINELCQKEIALNQWKEVYNVKSEEIIAETDFKELYGKNNADIRKQHVRNELTDWYDTIKDLEFSITYLERRIFFLRELVKIKRLVYEAHLEI